MDSFIRLFPTYFPYDADSLLQLGAQGNYINTQHGRLLDMNSGCWHVPLGHARQEVRQAMQSTFTADPYFGYHEYILRLAEVLCRRTGYDRVLFAVSGSDAVDSALRIAWQCTLSCNAQQHAVVALRHGYHGGNAVTHAASGFEERRIFIPVGFQTHLVDAWATDNNCTDAEHHLKTHSIPWPQVSAFVFEPIQAEAGVKRLHPEAYRAITREVQAAGGLVIADEIATGIGRTGMLLASENLTPRPDMICIGKGLTNGEFPLSAVLMTDDVWQRIQASTTRRDIKYLYGYTHAAHPTGCLAALAVLDIVNDQLLAEVRSKGETLGEALRVLAQRHPRRVRAVRGSGLFWCLELVARRGSSDQVRATLLSRGIRVGIEGYMVMFVPPFTITLEEIATVSKALDEALSLK